MTVGIPASASAESSTFAARPRHAVSRARAHAATYRDVRIDGPSWCASRHRRRQFSLAMWGTGGRWVRCSRRTSTRSAPAAGRRHVVPHNVLRVSAIAVTLGSCWLLVVAHNASGARGARDARSYSASTARRPWPRRVGRFRKRGAQIASTPAPAGGGIAGTSRGADEHPYENAARRTRRGYNPLGRWCAASGRCRRYNEAAHRIGGFGVRHGQREQYDA